MDYSSFLQLAKSGSFFIYDIDKMYEQAILARHSSANILYACKANLLSSVLQTFNKAGLHFDVASIGELFQLKSLGITGEKISLTGPAKSETFIREALEWGVSTFVIESPLQMTLLENIAKDYSYTPNVLLRLQLKSNKIISSKNISALGMDIGTIKHLLPKMTLPFKGFHLFQWTNILSYDELQSFWNLGAQECKKITRHFQTLDYGGGVGIPYETKDAPLEWEQLNTLISEIKETHQIQDFRLEMGRFLTGPYGIYMTPIVDVKKTYQQNIIVLQGGINHLLMSYLYQQTLPVELLRHSQAPSALFSLHGPLCTVKDNLGIHALPEDISVNDLLIFKQMGAYGFDVSMPFFLAHNLPGEAIVTRGKLEIIREPMPASTWLK